MNHILTLLRKANYTYTVVIVQVKVFLRPVFMCLVNPGLGAFE